MTHITNNEAYYGNAPGYESKSPSKPDAFYLWGFVGEDTWALIMTRGRTQQEAKSWAEKSYHCVIPLEFLPVNAAQAYSRTHQFDWLHTAPLWVQGKSYADLDA